VLLPLFLIATLGACAWAYLTALHTYRFALQSFNPPATSPAAPADLPQLRDAEFRSADGRRLHAWLLPSHNGATIVYLHGSPADRADLLPEARFLAAAGYGALLLDFPGHGESEGPADWGRPSQLALSSALDFLSAQTPPPAWIGAVGFSMGSSVLASVAARDQRIRAVVLEGTYTDFETELRHEYGHRGPLTAWPGTLAARRCMDLSEMRPIDHVAAIAPRPLLLVAGTSDPIVPPRMSEKLYAVAGEPKELFMVPGAVHGQYAKTSPEAYLNRLAAFFDAASRPHAAAASRAAPPAAP
jgi:dipeptidyl aminopeptidase/acylaminoacyl peptidase